MQENKRVLLIDESYQPAISAEDIGKLQPIVQAFMESYVKNKDAMPINMWLQQELSRQLPDKSPEDIGQMVKEILDSVELMEKKKKSLQDFMKSGRSKEDWLAKEISQQTESMPKVERLSYMEDLNDGLTQAGIGLAEHLKIEKPFGQKVSNEPVKNEKVEYPRVTDFSARKNKNLGSEGGLSSAEEKEDLTTDIANISGAQQASTYTEGLDNAISTTNASYKDTFTTNAGTLNQNPNLDGFLAEQHHAQTFNMSAAANGSPYRAKVLVPEGKTYSKNSVDLEIVDTRTGKVVSRYQAKYCKDVDATADAFKKGNYRGQQKVVPADQVTTKDGKTTLKGMKATDHIEAPDGTKSTPLSKAGAKDQQIKAQQGKWKGKDYNDYEMKELTKGIAKNAGIAGAMGAFTGTGMYITGRLLTGKRIDGAEAIETAVKTGTDSAVKAAATSALKVGIEKGAVPTLAKVVRVMPNAAQGATIAGIACGAVEGLKAMVDVADGTCTAKQGYERMEEAAVSTAGGLIGGTKGMAIGASIGTVLGPIGTAVGGAVGSVIGGMLGSTVGRKVTQAAQKVRDVAWSGIKHAVRAVKSIASTACHAVSSFCSSVASCFGF